MLCLGLLYEVDVLGLADVDIVHYDDLCASLDFIAKLLEMLLHDLLEVIYMLTSQ